jgi:ElaB/YqjD/DUF883 family membrane-anchored ribosome-binding protein
MEKLGTLEEEEMETAQNRVENTMDKVKDGFNAAGEKAASFGNAVMEKGADLKKAAVKAGEKALKQTDAYVKENPRSSLLYAMGIGAVVGGLAVFLMGQCTRRD